MRGISYIIPILIYLFISSYFFQLIHFNRTMGCINGRPVLSQEDLDFIANHTAITRDEVDQQYENFLTRHPDGKITKRDFRNMMQV